MLRLRVGMTIFLRQVMPKWVSIDEGCKTESKHTDSAIIISET